MSWHLFHRFNPVSVRNYHDVSFGKPGIAQTQVLQRCECGKVKVRAIDGTWSLADVRGRAA